MSGILARRAQLAHVLRGDLVPVVEPGERLPHREAALRTLHTSSVPEYASCFSTAFQSPASSVWLGFRQRM